MNQYLPKYTECFAKDPRVGRPDGVRLLRQAEQQHEQVWDGEVKETVVGGRVHVVIASNDHTRRHITNQACHKYQCVDNRHWHGGAHVLPPGTQQQLQINWRHQRLCGIHRIVTCWVKWSKFTSRHQEPCFRLGVHLGNATNDFSYQITFYRRTADALCNTIKHNNDKRLGRKLTKRWTNDVKF